MLAAREKRNADEIDWKDLLRRARCPMLLAYGVRDPIVPWRLLRAAVAGLPHIRVAAFPISRHQPFDDEPEAFRARIREFLE